MSSISLDNPASFFSVADLSTGLPSMPGSYRHLQVRDSCSSVAIAELFGLFDNKGGWPPVLCVWASQGTKAFEGPMTQGNAVGGDLAFCAFVKPWRILVVVSGQGLLPWQVAVLLKFPLRACWGPDSSPPLENLCTLVQLLHWRYFEGLCSSCVLWVCCCCCYCSSAN